MNSETDIIWSTQQENAIRKIVKRYADEMLAMNIQPYVTDAERNELEISITGVVQFAILKLASQIDEVGTKDYPSASEMLAMPLEERQKWIDLSHYLAQDDDIEVLEAFDDLDFDDV